MSEVMRDVLAWLEEGRVADFWLRTQAQWNTIRALRDRGYIKYYPYGANGRGSWGITSDGRRALKS